MQLAAPVHLGRLQAEMCPWSPGGTSPFSSSSRGGFWASGCHYVPMAATLCSLLGMETSRMHKARNSLPQQQPWWPRGDVPCVGPWAPGQRMGELPPRCLGVGLWLGLSVVWRS